VDFNAKGKWEEGTVVSVEKITVKTFMMEIIVNGQVYAN
jgi:hypothetical protein